MFGTEYILATGAEVVAFLLTQAVMVGVAYAAYYVAGLFASSESASPGTMKMPTVSQYPLQTAERGTPIAKVYGTRRLAGNLIYAGPAIPYQVRHEAGETTTTTGGKGGGGETETEMQYVYETKYRRSFLLAICEGPADVIRIWKGNQEISINYAQLNEQFYGNGLGDGFVVTWFALPITVFDGNGNEGIKALTSLDYGEWPNLCCVFFENYDLGNSQALPNFTFEVNGGFEEGYPILKIADTEFHARYPDPEFAHDIPISNVDDLQAMSNNLDGHYYLTNDIDASETVTWNAGKGFRPIRGVGYIEPDYFFKGTLDGCGYKITGLYQNWGDSGDERQGGIFEEISGTGVDVGGVSNLMIEDGTFNIDPTWQGGILCNMTGPNDVGAPAVIFHNCHIVNCTLTCNEDLGFFAGSYWSWDEDTAYVTFQDCTVTGCTAYLSGTSFQEVGGLVGESQFNKFYNCRVTDTDFIKTVSFNEPVDVGGLVGYGYKNTFTDCAADTDILAGYYCGGLVGYSLGDDFIRCSARGTISCHPDVDSWSPGFGGLVGSADTDTFTDCYSWVDIMEDGVGLDLDYVDVAGLIGEYSEE